MSSLGLGFLFDDNVTYTKRSVLNMIQEKEFELLKRNWSQELNHLNRVIDFLNPTIKAKITLPPTFRSITEAL